MTGEILGYSQMSLLISAWEQGLGSDCVYRVHGSEGEYQMQGQHQEAFNSGERDRCGVETTSIGLEGAIGVAGPR